MGQAYWMRDLSRAQLSLRQLLSCTRVIMEAVPRQAVRGERSRCKGLMSSVHQMGILIARVLPVDVCNKEFPHV